MKTRNLSLFFTFIAWAAITVSVCADVKLPAVFSDNMVLQQKARVNVWGKADAGEKIIITTSWSRKKQKTIADSDGCWSITISTPKASSNAESMAIIGKNRLVINNILIGEVWVCSGQSNMEFPVDVDKTSRWKTAMTTVKEELKNADYPSIRLFRVEHQLAPEAPLYDCVGQWEVCTPATAAKFSAIGFVFGRKIHNETKLPVGMIQSTWGGTHAESWIKSEAMQGAYYDALRIEQKRVINAMPAEKARYNREMELYNTAKAINPDTVLKTPAKAKKLNDNLRMSTLWNGMINPILPYTMRGVIWYQGESNNNRSADYQAVFTDLIHSWRTEWKQGDFPFYFVQIAPYYKQRPLLREGQLRTMQTVDNTGMAVITDAGDSTDIHPRNKLIPGERLAAWALAHEYDKDVPYMGPVYKGMTVEGRSAVLSFDYVGGGLCAHGAVLNGFVVAGSDGVFYKANADICGDKVYVSAPEVAHPVAVRYGWGKFFRVNLFNKEGFPATPFRTDDWILND